MLMLMPTESTPKIILCPLLQLGGWGGGGGGKGGGVEGIKEYYIVIDRPTDICKPVHPYFRERFSTELVVHKSILIPVV